MNPSRSNGRRERGRERRKERVPADLVLGARHFRACESTKRRGLPGGLAEVQKSGNRTPPQRGPTFASHEQFTGVTQLFQRESSTPNRVLSAANLQVRKTCHKNGGYEHLSRNNHDLGTRKGVGPESWPSPRATKFKKSSKCLPAWGFYRGAARTLLPG